MSKSDWFIKHKAGMFKDKRIVRLMLSWEDCTAPGQGWVAYGLYWALMERMAVNKSASLDPDNINLFAWHLRLDEDQFMLFMECLVKADLIEKNRDGVYFCAFIQGHLDEIEKIRAVRSLGGKKRWEKRAENSNGETVELCELQGWLYVTRKKRRQK